MSILLPINLVKRLAMWRSNDVGDPIAELLDANEHAYEHPTLAQVALAIDRLSIIEEDPLRAELAMVKDEINKRALRRQPPQDIEAQRNVVRCMRDELTRIYIIASAHKLAMLEAAVARLQFAAGDVP